jgi:outer membrane lipoprotein-sorting protein
MKFDKNKQQDDEKFSSLLSSVGRKTIAPDREFLNKLKEESAKIFEASAPTGSGNLRESINIISIWRTIMKNPVTKLAITATIIIVVIIGTYQLGDSSSVAWAEVSQHILNAQTAVLDIIVGDEEAGGPVIHDQIKGSRIRRTLSNMENDVSIIDLEAWRVLALTVSEKKAAYIDLKGLPSMPNYMDTLRNLISELQEIPDFEVEELGTQEIDGQEAIGFLARHPRAEITIWADPETALPIRIEQVGGKLKVICKNVKFDVPMDESLFSMEVPEGYTLQEEELDLLGSTEEDFIEGLRILAELFDGQFPDGVAVEDYLRQAPLIEGKIKELGLSDEEEIGWGMKLSRHLLFIRFFKGQGEWHYAGTGVKLGDAQTPIFWYQPQGSETYRVIYGDLRVEDAAPQNLPEPISAEEQAEVNVAYQQWSKPEFTGTQEDLWHFTASGDISVRSDLTLLKGPEGTNLIPISLPYTSGKLTSVTFNEVAIPFRQVKAGRYELELPLQKLFTGQMKIRCKWTLSLDMLEKVDKADYSYRTVLKSLIPVVSYKLRVSLAPDSGFEFTKDTSKKRIAPFIWNSPKPEDDFGSCGIQIRKRN